MKRTKQQPEIYNLLKSGITDAQWLIGQGLIGEAQALLMKIQQANEEIFTTFDDPFEIKTDEKQEKRQTNLAAEMGVTKAYIRDLLSQHIIFQDCLDSPIQDQIILEKYEDEPYYHILYEVFNKTSHAYFKLGFDTRDLMLK